ncbi:MAG: hypothetical protein R2873_34170 [Caldilineaceae bacterium]
MRTPWVPVPYLSTAALAAAAMRVVQQPQVAVGGEHQLTLPFGDHPRAIDLVDGLEVVVQIFFFGRLCALPPLFDLPGEAVCVGERGRCGGGMYAIGRQEGFTGRAVIG